MGKCSNLELRLTTSIIGLIGFFALYYGTQPVYVTGILLSALVWILVVEWPRLVRPLSPLFWILTPLYPVMPFAVLAHFNQTSELHLFIPLICLLVFTNDTAAYFFGSLCGKNKLAPSISPNKTIEGLICGYLFTLAAFAAYLGPRFSLQFDKVLLLSITISSLATAGDLFESYLKRRAKIKDSGSLLPGHGGLLDRLDALLFVAVFFYMAQNHILKIIS